MFGDPVSNPKGWPLVKLEDCVTLDAPLVDPRLAEFSNLLHYGPDRIEKDIGRLLPAKTAAEDNLISKKFLCDERHVLYSKIRPYLNKVALSPGRCLCSADMYPVEPRVGIVDKFYLWFILRSASFLAYAEGCSGRANIPKINREQLLNFQLRLPSLGVQHNFHRAVEQLENNRLQHQAAHSRAGALFASLQHRAFTGQL
jgi:type I restriction enzyme S subunit